MSSKLLTQCHAAEVLEDTKPGLQELWLRPWGDGMLLEATALDMT